jgi:SAM-dependent methyltransferase
VMADLPFDTPGATEINLARLMHLAGLGLDLRNKHVLEVGAGVGRLTRFWEERDCQVISTDGRAGNVEENLRRHPWRDGYVYDADLEMSGQHTSFGTFDVVFCYGTLYHVSDPLQTIMELASVCNELFLLETRVFREDDGKVHRGSDTTIIDTSMHGRGCRPARDCLWHMLERFFPYAYVPRTQPWHAEFPLSWPAKMKEVRAVFVASRVELLVPTLLDHLIGEYEGRER